MRHKEPELHYVLKLGTVCFGCFKSQAGFWLVSNSSHMGSSPKMGFGWFESQPWGFSSQSEVNGFSWMVSPTCWTWVWACSGSWWWTGKPGVLQSMGLQRVGHDWVTELNWYACWEPVYPCAGGWGPHSNDPAHQWSVLKFKEWLTHSQCKPDEK